MSWGLLVGCRGDAHIDPPTVDIGQAVEGHDASIREEAGQHCPRHSAYAVYSPYLDKTLRCWHVRAMSSE